MSKPGDRSPKRTGPAARSKDREGSGPADEGESLDSLYSPEYLRECADAEARAERLAELKRRIAHNGYHVDPDRIAEELLLRGDLD